MHRAFCCLHFIESKGKYQVVAWVRGLDGGKFNEEAKAFEAAGFDGKVKHENTWTLLLPENTAFPR